MTSAHLKHRQFQRRLRERAANLISWMKLPIDDYFARTVDAASALNGICKGGFWVQPGALCTAPVHPAPPGDASGAAAPQLPTTTTPELLPRLSHGHSQAPSLGQGHLGAPSAQPHSPSPPLPGGRQSLSPRRPQAAPRPRPQPAGSRRPLPAPSPPGASPFAAARRWPRC